MKRYYLKKDDIFSHFLIFKNEPTVKNLMKLLRFYECFKININQIIIDSLSILHIKQTKETMEIIIEKGGDPNNKNEMGITPVMIQYGYLVIKYLYDNGADIYNIESHYGMNIIFWQKDPEAMEFLLTKDITIHIYNDFFFTKGKGLHNIYIQLFIDGGYDPYYQQYLSVSPLFLQQNLRSQYLMLNKYRDSFFMHIDLYAETPLFKTSITVEMIQLYLKYGEHINYQNLFQNTLLHIHFEPKIILFLLQNNADLMKRNIENETPFIHHLKRKNFHVCKIIKEYYSSTLIQRNWTRYIFQKKYIPPKNFKLKQNLMKNIEHLPPSQCNKFKGGIQYLNVLKDYYSISSTFPISSIPSLCIENPES